MVLYARALLLEEGHGIRTGFDANSQLGMGRANAKAIRRRMDAAHIDRTARNR